MEYESGVYRRKGFEWNQSLRREDKFLRFDSGFCCMVKKSVQRTNEFQLFCICLIPNNSWFTSLGFKCFMNSGGKFWNVSNLSEIKDKMAVTEQWTYWSKALLPPRICSLRKLRFYSKPSWWYTLLSYSNASVNACWDSSYLNMMIKPCLETVGPLSDCCIVMSDDRPNALFDETILFLV